MDKRGQKLSSPFDLTFHGAKSSNKSKAGTAVQFPSSHIDAVAAAEATDDEKTQKLDEEEEEAAGFLCVL